MSGLAFGRLANSSSPTVIIEFPGLVLGRAGAYRGERMAPASVGSRSAAQQPGKRVEAALEPLPEQVVVRTLEPLALDRRSP
jgi:hypothetical protein